jgi:hypothetical protein
MSQPESLSLGFLLAKNYGRLPAPVFSGANEANTPRWTAFTGNNLVRWRVPLLQALLDHKPVQP